MKSSLIRRKGTSMTSMEKKDLRMEEHTQAWTFLTSSASAEEE